jgi:hypothetical protein
MINQRSRSIFLCHGISFTVPFHPGSETVRRSLFAPELGANRNGSREIPSGSAQCLLHFATQCTPRSPSTSIFISLLGTRFRRLEVAGTRRRIRCRSSAPSNRRGRLACRRRWVQAQAEVEAQRCYEICSHDSLPLHSLHLLPSQPESPRQVLVAP